jgi:hypothetical protein
MLMRGIGLRRSRSDGSLGSAEKELDMIHRHLALIGVATFALIMGNSPLQCQESTGGAVKSAKERLSDKASDEQRVDNCHVPPEKRGTKPRPDCPAQQEADKSVSGQTQPNPKQ